MTDHERKICKNAFSFVEIHPDGKVYPCCPAWNNGYDFGNIFKDSHETIFNGIKAKEFRKSIMDGSYKYCNLDTCFGLLVSNLNGVIPDFISSDGTTTKYPSSVKFCHDYACNFRCITCRDQKTINSKEKTQYLNSLIDTHFIPILKDAGGISLNGSGELFASEHCRELVKKIAQVRPDIRFSIHTNGSLCNEKNCIELGILDKLYEVQVSIHSASTRTHKKITRTNLYKKIHKNLLWLSELKKMGKLKALILNFVVSGLNYREMKAFMKMAIRLDAVAAFWEYKPWGAELDKDYKNLAVFEPGNKNYKHLAKILQDDIFKHKNCRMNNILKDVSLKKVAVPTMNEKLNKLLGDFLCHFFFKRKQ